MRLSARLIGTQDRLASVLGCDPRERSAIVAGMLEHNNDSSGYWLKLGISVGIGTLGLVLGSGAVVIGAMLIAPLMTPLVTLGMGLAVGSPFLVLRSSVRVVASVAAAVGASAVTTRLLPFNELNAEIASRTTPTALDLFVAAFCALAGVLAVMRRDSDVASTAAGTSIGISLVPPLCVSGYGIGTSTWTVASGAALLFLTNFVAIVVVSSLSFSASGFNQVPIRSLETKAVGSLDHAPMTRRLAGVFASRGGPWLRLLMPLVLLGAVYVPLREALDEVVWQIRARKQVESIIAALPYRLVESRVHIERRQIRLNLVLLGTSQDAARTRARVERDIQKEAGIFPHLEVVAIPDARAFAGLEAALHRDTPPPTPQARSSPVDDVKRARSAVQAMLERRWPTSEAGPIVGLAFEGNGDTAALRVIHLGKPLDSTARAVLERVLTEDAVGPVRLIAEALPDEPLTLASLDDPRSLLQVAGLMGTARRADDIHVCVVVPALPEPDPKTGTPQAAMLSPALEVLSREPRVRVVSAGASTRVRFSVGPCRDEVPAQPSSLPPASAPPAR